MNKLIFVYNATSGNVNAMIDVAHKILSPATYTCDLCAITHGKFHERKEWRAFRESSDIDMEFLHKDEFEQQYASKFGVSYAYPVILKPEGYELYELLSAKAIEEITSPRELIAAIKRKS
ncbi:hypothetical protein GCM10009117_24410 [Gangjinia marincola]|uniref:GTPase n=1 Tax=Gangjinia marincola TaxID=578463 RepID=A0ABN1MJC0_9FLAO